MGVGVSEIGWGFGYMKEFSGDGTGKGTKLRVFRAWSGQELEQIRLSLRLKIAQKPCIVWSLGPKALKYES